MLRRTHVVPFTAERGGRITVEFLTDPDGRVTKFLDRLCRLMTRLEGRPRSVVLEALRRQERRVRDARRLAGLSKTLLDAARFAPDPLADRAAEVREAVFLARGQQWPPAPGDEDVPYREAADALGTTTDEARDALYADRPGRRRLKRAPRWDGARLLRRYNLELARAVLPDAVEMTVTAEGGWGDIFRAVKLGRLMYRVERVGDGGGSGATGSGRGRFRVTLTGPAAPFVTRARRYGIRFARVVPALARAPGWRLDAVIDRDGRRLDYTLEAGGPIRTRARRTRYDSAWERGLAAEFEEKIGPERGGWSLAREDTPVPVGDDLFLPDFTFRHDDGREALVEIVGFWTPEYINAKLDKVRRAGLDNLVLVVYRGLAAGADDAGGDSSGPDASVEATGYAPAPSAPFDDLPGAVLWFARKPRIGAVMEAVQHIAR
ncbi:MAG: DUF790 family protein [Candidatus Longimicrobiales bacterium M2_2A_002]